MPNPSPSFREIVNLEELQKLFTTFSAATGYPTGLVECASGEVLFGTGWRELCANFHRQNPASKEQCHAGNLKIEHGLEKPGDIRINRCPHGLVHGCTPIIVNGYRLANIFTGQVLFAPPDIDHFKKQARQFSYDEAAYLEALAETPVVSEEKFSAMLGFLAQMATMIARSGLANLRLQECAGNEKNLLYSVIDSIPDSIFIKDCESVYLDCNKAFKTFFGLTAKKISGQTDFDFFPEESARLFQEKDRTMLASGRPQRNQEWVKCEDDGERLFDTLKVPYRDGQGHLLGVIGISRDITELKKIEAENIALQAKLLEARKLEMVKTLAGGIAHDFNNALTSVIGNIELLKMNPSARNLRDCTKAVKESAYRMADLTKKLLAYARGGKYQERKLKLQDFLEKAVPKTGFRSNEKIAIELDLDCREAAIMADPEQLQMIINALIGNAVEAISEYGRIVLTCKTPNFTEAFKLQHEAVASGAYICFSVKDDGCGMSRECRERIFEPFFSTKFTGRGLSMAATYGIVKNHGGYINVNSTPGQGTEVEVYWPLLPPEPAQTAAIPAAPEKFTILVIEDDEMLLNLENKFLERLGYKVVLTAGNGREALRQVKEYDGGIDICLMDVRLPDMPAEFLYRQLTNIRPDLKVLLCSASALDWEAQKAIQAGAQGFLEKPFSLTQLQESLAKLTY